MYIQVNAGRNIGDEPMSATQWSRFKGELIDALYDFTTRHEMAAIEHHAGKGVWGNVREDSVHMSIPVATSVDMVALREQLQLLAGKYQQESIALIVGESELIG